MTFFRVLLLFCFFTPYSVAAVKSEHDHAKNRIPPGHILTKDGCTYEVQFDESKRRIKIIAKGLADPKPSSMTATFNSKKGGTPSKVNLQLLESHDGVDVFQSAPLIHGQPFIQFGVTFDVDLGR